MMAIRPSSLMALSKLDRDELSLTRARSSQPPCPASIPPPNHRSQRGLCARQRGAFGREPYQGRGLEECLESCPVHGQVDGPRPGRRCRLRPAEEPGRHLGFVDLQRDKAGNVGDTVQEPMVLVPQGANDVGSRDLASAGYPVLASTPTSCITAPAEQGMSPISSRIPAASRSGCARAGAEPRSGERAEGDEATALAAAAELTQPAAQDVLGRPLVPTCPSASGAAVRGGERR